jgi:hypothetical protein
MAQIIPIEMRIPKIYNVRMVSGRCGIGEGENEP